MVFVIYIEVNKTSTYLMMDGWLLKPTHEDESDSSDKTDGLLLKPSQKDGRDGSNIMISVCTVQGK